MLTFDCVFNVVRLFPGLYITQKGSVYPLPSWEQHDWKLIHSWIIFPMYVKNKPMLEISVIDGDYLIQMMTFLQIQGFSVVSMTDLFSLCFISVLVIFPRSFVVISSHQKCPSRCKKERYIPGPLPVGYTLWTVVLGVIIGICFYILTPALIPSKSYIHMRGVWPRLGVWIKPNLLATLGNPPMIFMGYVVFDLSNKHTSASVGRFAPELHPSFIGALASVCADALLYLLWWECINIIL